MLLRFILKNFLSFKDIVQFDMFPNNKRSTLLHHVYSQFDVPILKLGAIYGSNGAGKSNLVKALNFLQEFALNKTFLEKNRVSKWLYALRSESTEEPLMLAVEFIAPNDTCYIYQLEVSSKGVESEQLLISNFGKDEPKMVFERKKAQIRFGFDLPENIPALVVRLLKRNPWSSFLALNMEFPVVPNTDIFKALSWFKNSLVIIEMNSMIPTLIQMMRSNPPLMEFTDKTMRRLCLGISGLEIETENADEWLNKHADELSRSEIDNLKDNEFIARMDNARQSLSVFSEKGVKKVAKFVFKQVGDKGHIGDMDISAQSDGTVRLLTLLPAFYEAMKKKKTVVIDEINHQMHPALIVGLVEMFSSDPDTNGQLIFTTHETSFLEEYPVRQLQKEYQEVQGERGHRKEKLLRYDEIWFVDKKNGSSSIYSLNEFKFHNTLSVRNAYMDGRFGAFPHIDRACEVID